MAVRSVLFFSVLISSFVCPPLHADPVTEFIITADSLSRVGEDQFAVYIAERSILVGASVGELLDVAFEIGEGGDLDAEEENIAFTERVALEHERGSGS